MSKKRRFGLSNETVIVMFLSVGIGLADTQSSYADGCGAYCQARQVRAICHDAVKKKGLKGQQREVEFQKCMLEAVNYKQIERLTDDIETSRD